MCVWNHIVYPTRIDYNCSAIILYYSCWMFTVCVQYTMAMYHRCVISPKRTHMIYIYILLYCSRTHIFFFIIQSFFPTAMVFFAVGFTMTVLLSLLMEIIVSSIKVWPNLCSELIIFNIFCSKKICTYILLYAVWIFN